MSQLGLGVMINMLGGGERGAQFIKESIGKPIRKIEVSDHDLRVVFEDGLGFILSDQGQSCCESRYMTCDDKFEDVYGGRLLSVEVRSGDGIEDGHDAHDIEFLVVKTDKGDITVANHNEHNGYYGGFWIVAQPLYEGRKE